MSDHLRPDDVTSPDGRGVQLRRLARDTVRVVPNLVKLLGRLIRDPRIPRRTKLVVGLALAYVASPIDLIPEFIPVVGFADDLMIVVFAVNHLIQVAGEDVVLEHWDGPRDLLELIESVMEVASDLVPARLRRLLGRLSGS